MESVVNEEHAEKTEASVDRTSPKNGDQERQNPARSAAKEAPNLREPAGNGTHRARSEEPTAGFRQVSEEGGKDADQSEVEADLLAKKTERVQAQTALDRSISQRRQRLLLVGSYLLLVEALGFWL